mmetsp:Transcript_14175/g.26566  ORF Transcript_14175/g.26566 Transcript_14175/m.26566 type:complete len:94 (-) Transcript_14175:1014-1295(-)
MMKASAGSDVQTKIAKASSQLLCKIVRIFGRSSNLSSCVPCRCPEQSHQQRQGIQWLQQDLEKRARRVGRKSQCTKTASCVDTQKVGAKRQLR